MTAGAGYRACSLCAAGGRGCDPEKQQEGRLPFLGTEIIRRRFQTKTSLHKAQTLANLLQKRSHKTEVLSAQTGQKQALQLPFHMPGYDLEMKPLGQRDPRSLRLSQELRPRSLELQAHFRNHKVTLIKRGINKAENMENCSPQRFESHQLINKNKYC